MSESSRVNLTIRQGRIANCETRQGGNQDKPDARDYQVTVIIPTLAEATRRASLLHAIESIISQDDLRALPLVVINGTRYDSDLRDSLERRTDLSCLYLAEGHVSKARALGLEQIHTPYFSFLDDDDLLMEGALAHRMSLMDSPDKPDVVVTNIQVERHGLRSLLAQDLLDYASDPRHSIFELAWLHSSNNLFRASTIGAEYFADCDKFMEWTDIAIRLARDKRIAFTNRPTSIYRDTVDSASKQTAYFATQAKLMASLSRSDFSKKTLYLIDKKHSAALNALSLEALSEGKLGQAWLFHLRSLRVPGGSRYLSYTRKLFDLNCHKILPTRRSPTSE